VTADLLRGALPLRPDLVGLEPYGAPQLDVPHLLNVNENPYAPAPDVVADIAAAVAEAAHGLNRYPDRDFDALRSDLAAYLQVESGVALATEQVWAANGSNEIMLHVLQAFGGPGRTVLSFAPTYSMYPEYARDTFTGWVAGRREADFGLDPDVARAAIAEQRREIVKAGPGARIDGAIVDPFDKGRNRRLVEPVVGQMLGERGANLAMKSGAIHRRTP